MDNMEAGREMDARVAEKVMGWVWIYTKLNDEQKIIIPPDDTFGIIVPDPEHTSWWWGRDVRALVPEYSTDIAAAMQAEYKLREMGWFLSLTYDGMLWVAEFRDGTKKVVASAETPPLAICRSALMAIENG